MNRTVRGQLATAAVVVACLFAQAAALAQNAYIANTGGNTVSVIDTATNTVIGTIPVGSFPSGVAVTPDGSTVYVTNGGNPGTVSLINTATNTVTLTIPVGSVPTALAIQPAPPLRLAGTPGKATVTAKVSRRWPGSMAGSITQPQPWGFPSVAALQNAIRVFCGGGQAS